MTCGTNWTDTGLCGQSNNAVVVGSPALAAAYKAYLDRVWDDTVAAGGEPAELRGAVFRQANRTPADVKLGDGTAVRVRLSPNTPQKNKGANSPILPDPEEVFGLIKAAKQAVLFLLFHPATPSIIDAVA